MRRKNKVGGNNSGAGHFYFDRGIKQLLNLEDDMEKGIFMYIFFLLLYFGKVPISSRLSNLA